MAIVMKSGSLNLLERSGPVQACTGIALPLPACIRHTWDCLAASFKIIVLLNDSVPLAALSLFLAGFCLDSPVLQLFWQMVFSKGLSLPWFTYGLPTLLMLPVHPVPDYSSGNLHRYSNCRLRSCQWI